MCNTQKKTSLENLLLQDIPILNGNDSSQLEDWLTDIETVSELTGEGRTKLAQANSRGLVRTLISEALTLHKTWEDIKDSLHLKICNSDIHTFISYFMDIQRKRKRIPGSIYPIILKGKLADANLIMTLPLLKSL